MKKFFSFVAAAFLSTTMFAALPPAVVPTDADFNAYKADGATFVVGFYTEADVCNDIVWAGTANGWDAQTPVITFEAMDGFDNWYVCSFTDASEDVQGKPVQLKGDGTFSWDYQIGDDAVAIRGGVTVEPGYSGEVNLKGYTAGVNVIAATKWKLDNTPCVEAVKHDYTVLLKAPFCADAEGTYFDPAIIGDFNGWAEGVPMNFDEAKDAYVYTFNDAEKHSFKFKAVGDTDWSNQIQLYNAEEDSWYDNDNITLGAEETIELDYSAGKYTLCVEVEQAINNVFENAKIEKVLENGQLIIKVDGVRYTTTGARL